MLLNYFLILFCVSGRLPAMYVCVPHVRLVARESKRGHQIP